ncbi:HOC1 [Scenedesmus sp. PABB004]|nr:HOC1 [Scenedesmus sp. PABB004]
MRSRPASAPRRRGGSRGLLLLLLVAAPAGLRLGPAPAAGAGAPGQQQHLAAAPGAQRAQQRAQEPAAAPPRTAAAPSGAAQQLQAQRQTAQEQQAVAPPATQAARERQQQPEQQQQALPQAPAAAAAVIVPHAPGAAPAQPQRQQQQSAALAAELQRAAEQTAAAQRAAAAPLIVPHAPELAQRAPRPLRGAGLVVPGAAVAAAAAASAAGGAASAASAVSAPAPPRRVWARAPPGVPELRGYTFGSAKDTFELCHETSGLRRDIPLEELLPVFGLPGNLTQRPTTTLAEFVAMVAAIQPSFRVVSAPMLFGEADLGGLLAPAGGLPRLVHFTVRDKDALKPHQVVSMASWAAHNPGHALMLFDDADVREFMSSYYPDLLPTFDGLGSSVERTDLWRYLVLCRFGGVYADSDVVSARPIAGWAADAGLLVGIENVFTTPEEAKRRDYTRQVQMVQWAIAARPGHPVVCRMGRYVAAHVAEEAAGRYVDPDRDHAILERTGPGIWSSSVHDYIAAAGGDVASLVAGGVVGDVRVLPQPVFGCASATFNPAADSLPYVYHMFKGSWRSPPPSKLAAALGRLRAALRLGGGGPPSRRGRGAADSPAHDAALAAAAAAAAEAAEFARAAAARPAPGADAAPAVAVPPGGRSAALSPHPRLPVLDEQILEHKRAALLAAGAAGGAAAPLAAPDTRKLRSSQALLVRGAVVSPAGAPGAPGGEPELPSSALSGVPSLTVLVLVGLACAVYKQQQGAALVGTWAGRGRGLCVSARTSSAGGPLTRAASRLALSGAGAALGGAGAARPPLPERSSPRGGLGEAEVCYASSQQNGHPHRHKRSWGSSSFANFQQL